MAKFNLKEHIAKNKSTFFGSLTEGQFSWMTQDTGQQIGSQEGNTIPVYMFDNTGKYWFEPSYDGYGEFGGMDYYELLDRMNGGRGDRNEGVRKAFDPTLEGELLFPALVVSPSNFNYKTHDFTKEAETDPDQSWLPYEEDNNKYDDYDYGRDGFGDMDTPENYDEEDDMMEGYDEFKRVEKGKKKTVAKDKGEEDVYGAGVKKGEEIEKKKLKEAPINKEAIAEKIANFLQIPVEKLYGFELDGTDDIEELMASIVPQETLNNPEKKYQIKKAIEYFIEPVNTTGPSSDEVYPYGYGRGQGFGKSYENKTTMKKSELKAKIKEMIVAEMELDVQDTAKEASEYDFLAELEEMLNEADETEKDTAETDVTDVTVDDTETTDVTTTSEVDPNVKAVQDALTQAQAAAEKLGDKKLTDQIGNTITFFTRAHVVEKGAIAEGEENMASIGKKVEVAVEDKLKSTVSKLSDEQKDQLKAELAKAGITANSKIEDVAAKLNESLSEVEGDTKSKVASTLQDVGGALIKSLLVPIIPVAIGSLGPGVAAGFAITAGVAGGLIALAKLLGAEKSMEEGKEESINESMFPMLKKILK